MMFHTVPLTFKKPPPHSAGCHTQTQSFLRCLQTHGGTMEMQMCPFLFFPSKALRAYCQGIQLVCHRYSARGGEAAARRSHRVHTRQTGFGYQYTCHAVDRRQREDFLLHYGLCYKQISAKPPLVIVFVYKERINNALLIRFFSLETHETNKQISASGSLSKTLSAVT